MPKRINLPDDEYQRFLAVEEFFNAVSDSDFVKDVDRLTRGEGMCIDVVCCHFPSGMDEYELVVERGGKPLTGIEFSLYEDEIVIDVPTFRYYLKLACNAYVREHPEDRAKIEELLARPQPPLTPPGTNVSSGVEASQAA